MLCYLNGQFLPRASAAVPVEDRGFIFGDGVYEVWRVIDGRLFELDRHLARLARGIAELRIGAPEIVRREVLLEVADRILDESGLGEGEATLYVEVTRGVAPRTHVFPAAATPPTVFVMANRFTPPQEQRTRGAAAVTQADVRWLRCDLKTIQLLPNVMAKQAAQERGAIEALLVRDGMVTEGSHTNVMAVIGGVVRTHPLGNLVLPGVTRAVVLELARTLGIPAVEQAFSERELLAADEVFLVGTTTDIMPIVKVNDEPIGDGRPGAVTLRLYDAFRAYMDSAIAAASDRGVATSNR